MRKLLMSFSLTVLVIFGIYVSIKMLDIPPVYNSISNIVIKDTIKDTGVIGDVFFKYRWFDLVLVIVSLLLVSLSSLLRKVNILKSKKLESSDKER